jgi:hypothetical protein
VLLASPYNQLPQVPQCHTFEVDLPLWLHLCSTLVVCKDEVSSGQSGRLAVIYATLFKMIALNWEAKCRYRILAYWNTIERVSFVVRQMLLVFYSSSNSYSAPLHHKTPHSARFLSFGPATVSLGILRGEMYDGAIQIYSIINWARAEFR